MVRIVVAGTEGSAPREAGAAMLIWDGGTEGTIGGGALEWQAIARARAMTGGAAIDRVPLGPGIGQCCGGAVVLVSEVWTAAKLATLEGEVSARRIDGPEEMPLAVRRLIVRARAEGTRPATRLIDGWLVEPVARPARDLWIWGAGHVGRALVSVLSPLPELAITWVDSGRDRFPGAIPGGITPLWAANPADLVAHAPRRAEHLVLTYSHALDLELCHRILLRGHGGLGLIGSATKAARFRSRLGTLGHGAEAIAGIACPIGDPRLGKHPQAIAVGVAAALLAPGRVSGRVSDRVSRSATANETKKARDSAG
ncbi:xanthine dehydrogenase accessory protein XdhC [Acidimangrovimonas sediminis]|uniref:xanthine dehydrogenase accessory protein XdhC n=1 Tax=Acidimangrovimonas sediminis TaxID=2056283 RepID=UPI001E28E2D1